MSQITVLDKNNVPVGPFSREQVSEKLKNGDISLNDLAFVEGLSEWTPLRDVLVRTEAVSPIAPPIVEAPLQPVVAPTSPAAYSYAATMQPPSNLVYAGFWIRVVAHLLDNLIVSIPFLIIWIGVVAAVVGFGVFAQISHQQGNNPAALPSAALIGTFILLYLSLIVGRIIMVWLYHAILESGPHESTWGKRIMGLRVTSMTGERITFGHASGRYFSTLVTGMTMGIGYLMVAFTDKKQTLHDMIAGTLVVRN